MLDLSKVILRYEYGDGSPGVYPWADLDSQHEQGLLSDWLLWLFVDAGTGESIPVQYLPNELIIDLTALKGS